MLENDTDYHFLVIENALREMRFDCHVLPHRLEKNLKLIRDELGWIERHHLPSGISETIMARIKEKTIYVTSEKGKNAVAFQIHNIIRRPYVFELVGIKITFGTSENGNPGLVFEGTRKDPVILKATDLPWIKDDDMKTPRKFAKLVKGHIISPKALAEKVEDFAVVDLGLVEMNELGLCEIEHEAMPKEKIEEKKEKAKPKPKPATVSQTTRGSEDFVTKREHQTPPMYNQKQFAFMSGMGMPDITGGYVPDWGPMDE